jgi:transcriptional regulator with XRE-family HTH domain
VQDRLKRAKELLGARLDQLREQAGLSKTELAEAAKVDRTYVHDLLAGEGNPTIEMYAKLASACGVDFEEFLAGLNPDSQPAAHQAYYRMLKAILNSGVRELAESLFVVLEALSEKAGRLKRIRDGPARPEPGTAGGQATGGGPITHRRRRA